MTIGKGKGEGMGDRSKIEWCDATWNPITGCSPASDGCANCYASRQIRSGRTPAVHGNKDFEKVIFHPSRLDVPLRWKRPRRIFVCSMGDLFHEDVSDLMRDQILGVSIGAPQHTYMVLTKRPERMRQYFNGTNPGPNIWLGVTVEDMDHLYRAEYLMQTPAAKRFVSVEPCLGYIDFKGYLPGLDWIICGGESGPGARPMHPDWAWRLRDQCFSAKTPFFFKQWGEWAGPCEAQYNPVLCEGKPHIDVEPLSRSRGGCMPNFQLFRVGKKTAGCLLDGHEWKEFPGK